MYYDIIVEDKKLLGLNPTLFGYEDCASMHAFGPAVRTHWLFHYVTKGGGIFEINNKIYKVGHGEMFVIPPYVETFYQADEKDPWNYIWIGFTSDMPFPKNLEEVVLCPEAEIIFEKMKSCVNYSGRSEFLCARLWDLFALLLGKESEKCDYAQMAVDYINSNYMNELSVKNLAKHLNLERTYFSAMFKQKTGISPKQYLIKKRMEVAASLMKNNSISVTVASNSVGYGDAFAFSKMFKKFYGVSPKEYAKFCK